MQKTQNMDSGDDDNIADSETISVYDHVDEGEVSPEVIISDGL